MSSEFVSMNVPSIMSRSTTRKVMTNLLLLIERMALASIMGMLFFASTQPKGAEAEIIININAVPIALCLVISTNCLKFISPYANAASRNAYITEIAAASVAVAMPLMMLPSTNTGIARAGIA